MSGTLVSRMPADEYRVIDAVSITRLKELSRSPLHYRHLLTHPKQTEPLALGTAAHCAVLEPERFERQFAIWRRRTAAGDMAPRRGQHWEEFCAEHEGREIITEDQAALVGAIASAVRSDIASEKYLEAGEPEVVMQWAWDRACKGRIDWLTHIDGAPVVVGLKTCRDCRHYQFGAAAAKLGYALQWAFYFDGFKHIKGSAPRMVEIVVESAPPHAVAVYRIPEDILQYGREEYTRLLGVLAECETTDFWPGPVLEEEVLTLPSYVYQNDDDDIGDLGLVA